MLYRCYHQTIQEGQLVNRLHLDRIVLVKYRLLHLSFVQLIFQRSCAGCHATDLSGATGPDLRKVGGKYDAADIEEIIKKGRGSMSPGLIQGEDAKKVAEWLAEHK